MVLRVIYVSTKKQGGKNMDRKEMVKRIGEHFGVKPLYLNVPTFAYEIRTVDETYTVDRVGNITNAQGKKLTLEEILNPPVVSEPEKKIEILNEETELSLFTTLQVVLHLEYVNEVVYESSNPEVAIVSIDGLIEALKEGEISPL